MALIATTPPLQRLDSASTTTFLSTLLGRRHDEALSFGRISENRAKGLSQRETRCESQMPFAKRQRPHTCVWLRFCSVNDSVGAALLDVSICSTQRNLGGAESHPREKDKCARRRTNRPGCGYGKQGRRACHHSKDAKDGIQLPISPLQ